MSGTGPAAKLPLMTTRASRRSGAPTMRARLLLLLTALPFVALVAGGCDEAEPPPLQVGEVAFTEEELLGLSPDRRGLLAELTAFGLAAALEELTAMAEPLLERRRRELLGRLVAAEQELDSMGVSDDILRARYRTDPAWELTVRHLIALSERFEGREARMAARDKAARALARIRAGEPFPQVAAEVSEEPGAETREGLLNPGRQGAWVPEFWAAAVALEVGEVSPVVETQYGFHVIRLEGKDTVPFEEARPRVLLEAANLMGLRGASAGDGLPLPSDLDVDRVVVDRLRDPASPDSLTAARWAGGRLALGDLRDHVATLSLPEWRVTVDGGTERRVAKAEQAVQLRLAADSARARGLDVPPDAESELLSSWEETALRWAAALGFQAGLDEEGVKAAALRALGATNQNAVIAREELRQQGPLVRRAYPIRVREEAGAAVRVRDGAGAEVSGADRSSRPFGPSERLRERRGRQGGEDLAETPGQGTS